MICLCCGKPIKNKGAASCGWHHSCIKHFFGTVRLPEITISNEALEWIANETISKGYTVPGVQKKLSLHLSKEEKARPTFVSYPSGYILKPQTNEYRALPEETALALNGKKSNLRKKDFFALAAACHLSSAAAEKMIGNLIKKVDVLISIAEHAEIPDDIRQACIALLIERAAVFA